MIIKKKDAILRKGNNIQIFNYITKDVCNDVSFSVVELSGNHNKTKNIKSNRIYYILEGEATVEIEGKKTDVTEGDVIFISKGDIHSIHGKTKYVVVNAPSFDIQNEVSI